jgi:hypothetical protein
MEMVRRILLALWGAVWTRENLYAVLLCALLILLLITTTDAAPQWIYQGF